jgi:hypothetical protein
MVQRREKEKDSRYIQEASAPAAAPCIRPVTCLRHMYTSNTACYDMGRAVCVYRLKVQRKEKEKDSRYIQEASAPATAKVQIDYRLRYTQLITSFPWTPAQRVVYSRP